MTLRSAVGKNCYAWNKSLKKLSLASDISSDETKALPAPVELPKPNDTSIFTSSGAEAAASVQAVSTTSLDAAALPAANPDGFIGARILGLESQPLSPQVGAGGRKTSFVFFGYR